MDPKSPENLEIIGNSAFITLQGIKNIPAKIDTGAEGSSVWASDIAISADNELSFCLFAPGSEFYTGVPIIVDEYEATSIRSSIGEVQVRYRVRLSVGIGGKKLKASFTLADRSQNTFPVLIGRRLLKNRFLVDVSRLEVPYPRRLRRKRLKSELKRNPQEFHKKYMAEPS